MTTPRLPSSIPWETFVSTLTAGMGPALLRLETVVRSDARIEAAWAVEGPTGEPIEGSCIVSSFPEVGGSMLQSVRDEVEATLDDFEADGLLFEAEMLIAGIDGILRHPEALVVGGQ